MAAPPEVTLQDLSGHYALNKTLSDDIEPCMALQGVNWFLRKGIGLASVTIKIRQYTQDGDVHVDVDQFVTGGIKASSELRTLDWVDRSHPDLIFGDLHGHSRMVRVADLEPGNGQEDRDYLGQGLLDVDQPHLQSWVENKPLGWYAIQIWGFQTVDGLRRYCRNIVVTKGEEKIKLRLVYDYLGKADA